MTMDFHNGQGERFYCSNAQWAAMLELAASYGWEPAGTLMPSHDQGEGRTWPEEHGRPWDGSYTSNDGQQVTAKDAANLADALTRALAQHSDHGGLLSPSIAYFQRGSFWIW